MTPRPDIPPSIETAMRRLNFDPGDPERGATPEEWAAFNDAISAFIETLPTIEQRINENQNVSDYLATCSARLYKAARDRLLQSLMTLTTEQIVECLAGLDRMRESLRPAYERLRGDLPDEATDWRRAARAELVTIFHIDDEGRPVRFSEDQQSYLRHLREEMDAESSE